MLRENLECANAVLAKASETAEKLIEAQNTILYLADECQKQKSATQASKTPLSLLDDRTNQVFLPLAPNENLFTSTFSHMMSPPPPLPTLASSISTTFSTKLSESLAALMTASANLSSSDSFRPSTSTSATKAATARDARTCIFSSGGLIPSSSTIGEKPKAESMTNPFLPSRPQEIQQIGNICQDPIFRFGFTAKSEIPTGGAASSSNNT